MNTYPLLLQKPSDVVKVVLFGPESTGKTTLSRQLARHYDTVWVREFARNYLQDKWNYERKTCEQQDLIPIAIGQMGLENDLAPKANQVLVCDTDILETMVYSEAYYGGFVEPELEKAAKHNQYDLYLLTYIDTPWEKDDLRDRPDRRKEMFDAFHQTLIDNNRPFIILKGNKITRLRAATKAINEILAKKKEKGQSPDNPT